MPRSLRSIDNGLIYYVSNRLPILGKATIVPNGVDVTNVLPDRRLLSVPPLTSRLVQTIDS